MFLVQITANVQEEFEEDKKKISTFLWTLQSPIIVVFGLHTRHYLLKLYKAKKQSSFSYEWFHKYGPQQKKLK